MKETIVEIFANYSKYIVLIHVLSAVIWVGGMIAIRLFVHTNAVRIDSNVIKFELILNYLKSFFNIALFCIILLFATAILMAIGLGFKGTPLYTIIHVKEAILTIMLLVFIYIYKKRNRAQEFFDSHNYEATKKELKPIGILIPINIVLGLVAIYFGVVLRGFA